MQSKVFPNHPFLMVFSKIAMIITAVMIIFVGLAVWQSQWMWYLIGGGLLISVMVFIILNQRVLQSLTCPDCHQPIAFEKGEGLVCQKCKTIWELS